MKLAYSIAWLFLVLKTYLSDGCEQTDKTLVHISSIKEYLYDDCVETDFMNGYLDSFLNSCYFHPIFASSFGSCTKECTQQLNCSAMAYNSTDGCYVCIQGVVLEGYHIGFDNLYIAIEMLRDHIGYFHTAHSQYFNWCGDTTQELHIGDFNGDGFDDMLCHQRLPGITWPQGKIGIAYHMPGSRGFSQDQWEHEMSFCIFADQELHIGDFNGDGRSDMLCHRYATEDMYVALATENGRFADVSWHGLSGWCIFAPDEQLFVGDFNGDGRDDILCHNYGSGRRMGSYANADASFTNTDWHDSYAWCESPQSILFTNGDFNGDGINDLLCKIHDFVGIGLMDPNSAFAGTHWHANGFCFWGNQSLSIADVNGDGRDDILCHDSDYGSVWIMLVLEDATSSGISWQNSGGWCDEENAKLLSGNFDGDSKKDFTCKIVNRLCYTTTN